MGTLADNFRISISVVPVDFMDKVVRSDYRSGHSNLFPFIDRDPLPFILILHLHLIRVVRAAWKQPAGNVSVSGGRDVSVAPHLRGFVVFVSFCVFLRPFVHQQTAKKKKKKNVKLTFVEGTALLFLPILLVSLSM